MHERETQGIFNEIAKIGTSFNADRSLFEKHAGTLGKIGNEFLKQSGLINATNIKLARDIIAAVGKFVGMDLAFKFKPWGAVKLAGNLNKAYHLSVLLLKHGILITNIKKSKHLKKLKKWYLILTIKKKKF
ncbi:LeoA/HP0731 family dynamin-like GTPase [Helicobacter pylori]|uniref:LeoA/HP0731 family dynamin-like GTPase n=1 Tax=Helicobacter pylori TaxID=210 RepID=UPI0039E1F603